MDIRKFIRNNKKTIGIISICIGISLVTYVGYKMSTPKLIMENEFELLVDNSKEDEIIKESQEAIAVNDSSEEDIKEETSKDIFVQIIGEVNNPGVYNLKTGSRIRDLIFSAGGFTQDADKTINQALKLKDEDSVIIYKVGENPGDANYISGSKIDKSGESDKEELYDAGSKKININLATKEELMTLSGIGEGYATRIIEYRDKYGGFKDISDIKKVKGIGDKTYESLKENIEV